MTKKKVEEKVVEADFTDVEPAVRCAITVGMTEEGSLFLNIEGSDQTLISMEGLLKYAERHMDRVWRDRLESIGKAE